jgi:hypothetical protein
MTSTPHIQPARRWLLLALVASLGVAACSGRAGTTPGASATQSEAASASPPSIPTGTPMTSDEPTPTQEPDTGTTSGDVPDNAVFLTYRDPTLGFSIQYVEGWQVTPAGDGVGIRDKDSSELVRLVAAQPDVPGYVTTTDLPALRGEAGFHLHKQDTVDVKGTKLTHLVYAIDAPPDPVTGKRVPSVVDRYYVPGAAGLAIVSLSTPKGVDNVDAFPHMIESFRWGS